MNAENTIMVLLEENTVTLLGGGNNLYEVDRTRLKCWTDGDQWGHSVPCFMRTRLHVRGGIGIRCMRWRMGHGGIAEPERRECG